VDDQGSAKPDHQKGAVVEIQLKPTSSIFTADFEMHP